MRQQNIAVLLKSLRTPGFLLGGALFALLALINLSACAGKEASASFEEDFEPADFRLASCFDVVATEERVHLLFGQPAGREGDDLAFFYTRSDNSGAAWSDPVRVFVDHAPPGRHGRGNDPRLAVSGDLLMAAWTARGEGPWGSGALAAGISSDGGKTWKAAPAPVAPGAGPEAGYRFPATAADEHAFHAVWIHAEGEERSLRYAQLPFGEDRWSEPVVIDPHICACCWNTLTISEDGALVALYRGQDPSDMGLAISRDRGGSWDVSGPVGAFDWDFNGCPHVGGGLAAGPGAGGAMSILASVWTGHPEHAGGYLLRSEDSGRSWERTGELGRGSQKGRNTDLAIGTGALATVAWDQPVEDESGQAIFIATSDNAGSSWDVPLRLSPLNERATHPRVLVIGNRALVFWTGFAADNSTLLRMESITMAE
ncbi:MAG: sialidase family protein [Opitutales bacterium]